MGNRDMRALKAGALYFALVFAAGWIFGPIREVWVVPRFGRSAGLLFEAPLMLLVVIAAPRWTVQHLAVPPAFTTRAPVGLIAFGMLVVAEVIGARWLRALSIADYLAGFRSVPGGVSLLLFLLFAAMPTILGRRSPGPTGHPRS